MKRVLYSLVAVVLVVLAAALIVPSFIDWNQYRAQIASEASDALGRTVEIRGDIGLSLLPKPVFFVKDAHLANVEGASDADMASLDSVEVRVALAPLLAGNIRIESVKLVRPVLNIETMEGGSTNMVFDRRPADSRAKGLEPKIPLTTGVKIATSDDGALDVSIDNFVIEKGTLVVRNATTGLVERIEDINGRLGISSLRGPFVAVGSAVVRGIPVTLDLETGAIIQGRTMPLSFELGAAPGAAKAQFSGSLNTIDEAPQLKGRITAQGEDLRAFAAGFGIAAPAVLQRTFGAVGNLSVNAEGGELTDLAVRVDGAQGSGRVAVALEPHLMVDASLVVPRLDLDGFLKTPPRASAAASDAAAVQKAGALDVPAKPLVASSEGVSLQGLRDRLSANLNLSVELLTWRLETVRQAKVSLSLANGEITVNQMTAMLPGGSEVALFGFVTEQNKALQFDGTLDATTNDLRATLDWLGVSTAGIPSERLRRFSLNAKLSARTDTAALTDIHARLDGTQIDGNTAIELAERPSVGAALALDRLNLDAYLPARANAASPGVNPLAALAPLAAIDADVRARVAALTYRNLPFNDVRLEAAARDGAIEVKTFSVGDVVGVSGTLSGGVTGLSRPVSGEPEPKFKDVVLNAKGKSLTALFRMAQIDSPVPLDSLGPSALTLRLDGGIAALDLGIELATLGGTGSLSGRLLGRDVIPRFEGRFALSHPDFARFVRGLGFDYRPRSAKGGIDVAGKLGGSILEFGVSELAGTLAGMRLQGSASVGLLGRRPRVVAKFATGDVDIDAFLPAKRTAAREDRARVIPAAAVVTPRATIGPSSVVPAAAPWSSEPIDASALTAIDGAFHVTSDSIKYGGLAVASAELEAELKDGALLIRHFIGKSYGGDLTVDGALAAESQGLKVQARYALGGADMAAAVRAFGGKGISGGRLTSEGQIAGGGRSMAEIVGSLAGEGTLAVRELEAGGGGIFGTIAGSLDRIATVAGAGRSKAGHLDLSGPYRIASGVVTFDELAFTSGIGEGALSGTANLPKWHLSARGEVRLVKTVLSELAVRDTGAAKPIPFELEGALDAPRVKIDIARLPGGGVRVPGLDRLRERIAPAPAARPVPPVKEEASPPPAQAQPRAVPEPAPSTPEPKPEPKRAERAQDILRDILKGIVR